MVAWVGFEKLESLVPPLPRLGRFTHVMPAQTVDMKPARVSEPRAVTRLHGKKPESFEDFYQREFRPLVGLAYVLTGSHTVAEDLAHDALAEAHKRWDTVAFFDSPGPWVRRVMINKSTTRFRRLRSETKALTRINARPEVRIEPEERSMEVWEAVRALPNRQAQTVALFYWEDRSLPEIAEILELSVETAKTHLKRARAKLATQLESHRGEFS